MGLLPSVSLAGVATGTRKKILLAWGTQKAKWDILDKVSKPECGDSTPDALAPWGHFRYNRGTSLLHLA
jgi:hypothetical protein